MLGRAILICSLHRGGSAALVALSVFFTELPERTNLRRHALGGGYQSVAWRPGKVVGEFPAASSRGSRLRKVRQRGLVDAKKRRRQAIAWTVHLRVPNAIRDATHGGQRSAKPLAGIVIDKEREGAVTAKLPPAQTTKEPFE